jgi:hypothetical protein
MHPDLMVEVTRLRITDMRSEARDARLARSLRRAARAQRSGKAMVADLPVIPDYIHEMFAETSTGHPVA